MMLKTLDQFKLINGTILLCEEEYDDTTNTELIQHMKIKLMLEHTDTITDSEEYVIVDDQVIREIKQIKQSLKRKLSTSDDDDHVQHLDSQENESIIVKKTKRLSTVADEPMHTSFVVLVDDEGPVQTNGHHPATSKIDLNENVMSNESDSCVILNDNEDDDDCQCIDITDP